MNVHVGIENTVPAGWSIRAKVVESQRVDGSTLLTQVHVYVRGAPPGTRFEQQTMPVGTDKASATMSGISVGKNGILMCSGRTEYDCGTAAKPDDPIEFTSQSIAGEPIRLLFVSPAGTIGIVLVPNPIAKTKKGCGLSAVRLTSGFELALIAGSGYPPDSEIRYTVVPGETAGAVVTTDHLGAFRFALLAHAKGSQKSGTTTVKASGMGCSPAVSYTWGR